MPQRQKGRDILNQGRETLSSAIDRGRRSLSAGEGRGRTRERLERGFPRHHCGGHAWASCRSGSSWPPVCSPSACRADRSGRTRTWSTDGERECHREGRRTRRRACRNRSNASTACLRCCRPPRSHAGHHSNAVAAWLVSAALMTGLRATIAALHTGMAQPATTPALVRRRRRALHLARVQVALVRDGANALRRHCLGTRSSARASSRLHSFHLRTPVRRADNEVFKHRLVHPCYPSRARSARQRCLPSKHRRPRSSAGGLSTRN